MTEKELVEIENRALATPPGPWEWGESDSEGWIDNLHPKGNLMRKVRREAIIQGVEAYGLHVINPAVEEFLIRCREDVLELVKALREKK